MKSTLLFGKNVGKEELVKANITLSETGATVIALPDMRATTNDLLPDFFNFLSDKRGLGNNKFGKNVDYSLSDGIADFFALTTTVTDNKGNVNKVGDVKRFIKLFGIDPASMSFNDISQMIYSQNLEANQFHTASESYSRVGFSAGFNRVGDKWEPKQNFTFAGAPTASGDINPAFHFIFPEIINEAIRSGYQHMSQSQNWILGTVTTDQQSVTMPRIVRGDGRTAYMAEGSDFRLGSVKFEQKYAKVQKHGVKFKFTDEILFSSKIDMLFESLKECGNEMALEKDNFALAVLVSGEQSDGSESAPVIGINDTSSGFLEGDILRAMGQMQRAGRPIDRLIIPLNKAIMDLNATYSGRDYTTISEALAKAGYNVKSDLRQVNGTNNQILFLSSSTAMYELRFRGLLIERTRDVETQTNTMVVSDYIGFAKARRDGALIVDATVAYSDTIGASGAFPTYLDIDGILATSILPF